MDSMHVRGDEHVAECSVDSIWYAQIGVIEHRSTVQYDFEDQYRDRRRTEYRDQAKLESE
jgi:hypothetical protein